MARKTNTKKRKNLKKLKRSLRVIFLLILIVGASIAFMHSNYFLVSEITVTGSNRLTVREILDLAKIEKGTNIFSLNYSSMKKRLSSNCWVDEVEIKRKLPNKVVIDIKERVPLASLVINQRFVNVDVNGFILSSDMVCKDNLPLITGITYKEKLELGNQITADDLPQILKVVSILGNKTLDKISEINLKQKDNIYIYMLDGLEIRLGNYNELEKRLKILIPLLQDSQIKNSAIEYVDMRFDRPVIKWR